MDLATEYLAWLYVGITKLIPILMLTAIIYKLIMHKREKALQHIKQQQYIRVIYSKGRAYDYEAGQNFNEIA